MNTLFNEEFKSYEFETSDRYYSFKKKCFEINYNEEKINVCARVVKIEGVTALLQAFYYPSQIAYSYLYNRMVMGDWFIHGGKMANGTDELREKYRYKGFDSEFDKLFPMIKDVNSPTQCS